MSRLVVILLLAVFLSACGNKGALYLPNADSSVTQPIKTDY